MNNNILNRKIFEAVIKSQTYGLNVIYPAMKALKETGIKAISGKKLKLPNKQLSRLKIKFYTRWRK